MRAANCSGLFVACAQVNTRSGSAVFPGARDAAGCDALGGARKSHLSMLKHGALAILAGALVVGCGTHRENVATAPVAPSDAARDSVASVSELGATSETSEAATTTLGGPIAGLDAAQLARFDVGRDDFMEVETVDDGIGPVFNEASCATCHDAPVGGTTGRSETRFGRMVSGQFDPLPDRGGSLMQDHAIGAVPAGAGTFTFVPEVVPREATVSAQRITTPLFGLGLVDAVPDATFLILARLEGLYSPSTRGIPSLVTEIRTGATRVGRFGWKAQVPTLHQFAGDAYINEMGVTNPEFPNENCPQGDCAPLAFNPDPGLNNDGQDVDHFADFMTLLGPPKRGNRAFQSEAGEQVFRRIGCASCHTPALVTGFSPVRALSHKVFEPYSDFLLHDMGALGDGIVQNLADGREMRTAPLWGLSARSVYLHDGRAKTVHDAILGHSGQGAPARDRFLGLNPRMQAALIAFLQSL